MSSGYNTCADCGAPKILNNMDVKDNILFTVRSMAKDIKTMVFIAKIYLGLLITAFLIGLFLS